MTVNFADSSNAFSGREIPAAGSFDLAGAVVSVLAEAIATAQANSTTVTYGTFTISTS